MKQITK